MTSPAVKRPRPSRPPEPGSAAPRRPQQERSKRTVEAILDAAEVLLAAPGPVGGLNMRSLARAAGVGPATLYEYFPTLDAVREALELRAWRRLLEQLQAAFAAAEGAPLETLVRSIVEVALREMVVPARIHGLQPSPKWFDKRVKLVQTFVAAAAPILAQHEATLVREDAEAALTVVAHAVVHLIRIGVSEYPDDYASGRYTKQVVDMVTRFLVRP